MRAAIISLGTIASMHAWHGDAARMLRREKPDFVTVATPSGAHLPAVLAAARRGVYVICEKPLEISLKRIDRMIAACDKAGVTLGAIFPQRFNPVVCTVHEAAAAGRFGSLALAASYVPWCRDDAYYGPGRWQGTKALDGGAALMNQSIHGVDALQWIVGATMPELAGLRGPSMAPVGTGTVVPP